MFAWHQRLVLYCRHRSFYFNTYSNKMEPGILVHFFIATTSHCCKYVHLRSICIPKYVNIYLITHTTYPILNRSAYLAARLKRYPVTCCSYVGLPAYRVRWVFSSAGGDDVYRFSGNRFPIMFSLHFQVSKWRHASGTWPRVTSYNHVYHISTGIFFLYRETPFLDSTY